MSEDFTTESRSRVRAALGKYLPSNRSTELPATDIDPAYAELEWRRMLVADAYEAYLLDCLQSDQAGNEPDALMALACATGEDLEFIFEVLDVCRSTT